MATEPKGASYQGQQSEVQTAPITEPRSAQGKSRRPQAAKGAAAIFQQNAKCSRSLIVNANALFEPGRWTLNPDAAQTLEPLVSLMTAAGKHPLHIDSYARSGDSDRDNQILAEKRGLTVRGWLSNQGYISPSTPVEGFGRTASAQRASNNSGHPTQQEEQVQLIFDTCE